MKRRNPRTRIVPPEAYEEYERITEGGVDDDTMVMHFNHALQDAISRQIRALPAVGYNRRRVEMAFLLIVFRLERDTGVIRLEEDALATLLKCKPDKIPAILGTLQDMGVIYPEGERYCLNPHIAWNGSPASMQKRLLRIDPPDPQLRVISSQPEPAA